MGKISFVIPWYGEKIPGGAEAALRALAEHLVEKQVDVEILSTCVEQFGSDWNIDYYPEGPDVVRGVKVRRFKVRKRDTAAFDRINYKFMNDLPVSAEEEMVFMQEMVNSTDLYEYIEMHQDESDVFVFTPYMFGTTYFGCQKCLEKSVLIPCFHDESYAYMQLFKEQFSKVRGMIFLSEAEAEFARRTYDLSDVETAVLGTGVQSGIIGNAERFRKKYKINKPYMIYAGRKDSGKNVDTLLKYFCQYKQMTKSPMKLVMIGGGEIQIPGEIKKDVIDLGFVSLQDKYDAFSGAVLLCNPSKFESFSLVIMESWLCKRPVLVYGGCEVTKQFAISSEGGMFFNDADDFVTAVDYIMSHKEEGDIMGENGQRYVMENFIWDVVTEKYIEFFNGVKDKKGDTHRAKRMCMDEMADKVSDINIEKIMAEIRADIKKKGYKADAVKFETVQAGNAEVFNKNTFGEEVRNVNMSYQVSYYFPIEGKMSFFKRVIRKLGCFLHVPILNNQNAFNAHVTRTFNQMALYIEQQERKEKELNRVIEELEEKVAALQKQQKEQKRKERE